MNRTPLRHRSTKYQAMMVKRRHFVKDLLEKRGYLCGAGLEGCTQRATDVHERLRRSQGGKIVGGKDEDYLTLCRNCHDFITRNPGFAFEKGFAVHNWEVDDEE